MKHFYAHIYLILILFLIVLGILLHYGIRQEKITDVIQLTGWVNQILFLENINIANGLITVDNTVGENKDGTFTFINRSNPLLISSHFQAEMQFNIKEGESSSIVFADAIPKDARNWWLADRGIEIELKKNNIIYPIYFDRKNNIYETYQTITLSNTRTLTIKFINSAMVFLDEKGKEIGKANIPEDLFKKEKFFLGFSLSPKSILTLSRFVIKVF